MKALRVLGMTLLLVLGTVLAAVPAQAAVVPFSYIATAGATKVSAVGVTVTSDVTSLSAISGTEVPKEASNTALSANVGSLVRTGTLTSNTKSWALGDGLRIGTEARTQGLSLLGGAIRATAVKTQSITTATSARRVGAASTEFVNLRIANVELPVDIGKNTKIEIPGVATVVLNAEIVQNSPDGIITTGYALLVRLLGKYGNFDVGTTIVVNPTWVAVAEADTTKGPVLSGTAYGTQVFASVGGEVNVHSGPTARVTLGPSGTGGEERVNSTASVNVPNVLQAGVVKSTMRGIRTPTTGEATTTNEVAGLNVLNGLITADVIKVRSHSIVNDDGVYTGTLTPTFVNLTIGGTKIPVNVGPNTTISVGDVLRVVVNHQVKTANAAAIRGLRITVVGEGVGLPIGAVIEVAVAGTAIQK